MVAFFCVIAWVLASSPMDVRAERFSQPDAENHPSLFHWADTCNVYLLREGAAAMFVNVGDGTVLEHLSELNITNVEWVLFTDHHREQSQGYAKLTNAFPRVKIAVPEAERFLFEQPLNVRRMSPRFGDLFTIYGISYVRPSIRPIRVDRAFSKMDTFTWRGREFWCVDTRGNSPGGMSYLLRENGRWLAFSGDVMVQGARMNNYFDSEWDYGFGAAIYDLHNSAELLGSFDPALLLPSHGAVIPRPRRELDSYRRKLRRLESDVLRGYSQARFSNADQDPVSKPSEVPFIWEVSPHVFKFKGPNYHPNFVMLLADSGHALLVDCGGFDLPFLDHTLALMKQRLGLKKIDAVLITHMHGDHMLEAPHLRENYGTEIWALDRMADQIERPERYDYVASIQTWNKPFDSIKLDRVLRSGEVLQWEGYRLTADWMPGQTEFAMGLHGTIDGRKVIFTGDNIFGNPADKDQNGHEAVVARNSAILEEGYIYGAEFLARLKPDLLLGGHSWVMDKPAPLIERYRKWAYRMRDTFRDLSSEEDYRYWFDPFWVRAEPYRQAVTPGGSAEITLCLRNFLKRTQHYRIRIDALPGLQVEPATFEISVPPESKTSFPVKIGAAQNQAPGVFIVAFDVSRDGRRLGQLFDCIFEIIP